MHSNSQAELYLSTINHNNYQIIALYEGSDSSKTGHTLTFRDGYTKSKAHIQKANDEGYGIFITVNVLKDPKSPTRKIKDYEYAIGVYIDVDNIEDSTPKPPNPTMCIESSPGKYHYYWLYEKPNKDWNTLKGFLNRAVVSYGADPAATDIGRILRLPGYKNNKPQYNEDNQSHIVRFVDPESKKPLDLTNLEALDNEQHNINRGGE